MKLSFAFLAIIMPWKLFLKLQSRIPAFTFLVPDTETVYYLTASLLFSCVLLSSLLQHNIYIIISNQIFCAPAVFSPFFSAAAVSFVLFPSATTHDHTAKSFVVPAPNSSDKFKESLLSLYLPKNVFIFPNLWGFLMAFFNIVLHRMKKKKWELERKLMSIIVKSLWRWGQSNSRD